MDFSVSLGDVAAFVVALVAIIKSFRSQPHEDAKADADAAKSYAEAAELAACRATKAEERYSQLEKQFQEFRIQYDATLAELRAALAERDRLIDEWRAGIERLLAQLKSHAIEPVWRPHSPKGK